MKLTSTACTHIGRRENNEDSFCVEPRLGLFAVADGMGGYVGGEVASRLAIETLTEFVRCNAGDDELTWPYAADTRLSLTENIAAIGARLAHQAIAIRRLGPLEKMGSTIAIMLAQGSRAAICHVGDSRVYRVRDGRIEQLTTDHSFYEELRASGCSDLPPREEFAHRNMITRALGLSGDPEVTEIELRSGDTFLLCTDGLSEEVSEARMAALLAGADIDTACQVMVREAYAAGGRDNITAVVVQCR